MAITSSVGTKDREQLAPRLITGDQREFITAEWSGTNESGWIPLGDKVLILMDEHADQTAGGVFIPEPMRDRQSMAAESGVVVAVGPRAFMDQKELDVVEGDRVAVERYAGQVVQGWDSRQYRLMSDSCVGAVAAEVPPK